MIYQHAHMMAAVAIPGILLSYGGQGKDVPPMDTPLAKQRIATSRLAGFISQKC